MKDYANGTFTDNHNTFGDIATYVATLKDYQTKLATFNELNTELTNLNNRIGADSDNGLQGSLLILMYIVQISTMHIMPQIRTMTIPKM